MAKGDHERGERRIDEQMKQSQSYLTGLQNQLGGQYAGMSNSYSGGFPQVGNVYGWGTTVPSYSQFGPIYSGNDTDKPVFGTGPGNQAYPRQGPGSTQNPINVSPGQGATDYRAQFDKIFPGQQLSPEMLDANSAQLQQMGIRLGRNAKGRATDIILPNGQVIDVIHGAGSGDNQKQWLEGGISREGALQGYTPYSGGQSFGTGPGTGGAVGMAFGDYGDIQGAYKGLYGDLSGKYNNLLGKWSGFADTGGFSEEDKANIRSRAISPIRSVYSRGREELDRQRALQGGYSPGFTTALGRFNREQGQLTSDATTNAEAAIAEMVQRGKLAGLGGMTGALGSNASSLGGLLGGRAGMYGTTPGLANMFGNQTLQSMQQQLGAAGLQNSLSMGIMNNQLGLAAVPGNFDSFMNSVGGVGRAAGQVGGAVYPWADDISGWFGGGAGSGKAGAAGAMPTSWGYG